MSDETPKVTPALREQIALAICCPDKDIRCPTDTCGASIEYSEEIRAVVDVLESQKSG